MVGVALPFLRMSDCPMDVNRALPVTVGFLAFRSGRSAAAPAAPMVCEPFRSSVLKLSRMSLVVTQRGPSRIVVAYCLFNWRES